MYFKTQKFRNDKCLRRFEVTAPNIWFNLTLIFFFAIFRLFGINDWQWYWIISPLWISLLIPIFWYVLYLFLWILVNTLISIIDTFKK